MEKCVVQYLFQLSVLLHTGERGGGPEWIHRERERERDRERATATTITIDRAAGERKRG
jgi:hypothetical protein